MSRNVPILPKFQITNQTFPNPYIYKTEEVDTVGKNERHEGPCPRVRHTNMNMKMMVGVLALAPPMKPIDPTINN